MNKENKVLPHRLTKLFITALVLACSATIPLTAQGPPPGVTSNRPVTGSGTSGTVAEWVTNSSLGPSPIKDVNGHVVIGVDLGLNADASAALTINGAGLFTGMNVIQQSQDHYGARILNFSNGGGLVGYSQGGRGITGVSDGTLPTFNPAGLSGQCTASSGFCNGVFGTAVSPTGIGVLGQAAFGVLGQSNSPTGSGVGGFNGSTTGGVGGTFTSAALNGVGLQAGNLAGGLAGQFNGDVAIGGNLTKKSGSFKIDHPLDPENKYLYHSFVESPDMLNIYNGIVVLGETGEATVALPDWFEALNKDFRYQLTCIGGHAPVYISSEVAGNRFQIAGGRPGLKISWQITGVRHDTYANAHRIRVEELKPASERGTGSSQTGQ